MHGGHPGPEPAPELPLRIYVPREGSSARAAVAERSGVVGSPGEDGCLILDYEANMHGAVNIKTFADKVHHAAGRHTARYPTRARTEVDTDAVVEVGVYDGGTVILHAGAEELVATWLEIDRAAVGDECLRSEGAAS